MQKVANNVYGKDIVFRTKYFVNWTKIVIFIPKIYLKYPKHVVSYHYLISFWKNPFHIAMMTLLNHNLVLPWINTITLLFWYQLFQRVCYRWIHKGLESNLNQFKSTIITPFVALYVFHSILELYLIPQVV